MAFIMWVGSIQSVEGLEVKSEESQSRRNFSQGNVIEDSPPFPDCWHVRQISDLPAPTSST